MYANFILTQSEPNLNGTTVELGTYCDGCILVEAYPAQIYIGGVIHLALEHDDDEGIYEVELRGTELGGGDTHILGNWSLRVPPPPPAWKPPRTRTILVPVHGTYVMGDMDMALDVELNRRWAARQTILVRAFSVG